MKRYQHSFAEAKKPYFVSVDEIFWNSFLCSPPRFFLQVPGVPIAASSCTFPWTLLLIELACFNLKYKNKWKFHCYYNKIDEPIPRTGRGYPELKKTSKKPTTHAGICMWFWAMEYDIGSFDGFLSYLRVSPVFPS